MAEITAKWTNPPPFPVKVSRTPYGNLYIIQRTDGDYQPIMTAPKYWTDKIPVFGYIDWSIMGVVMYYYAIDNKTIIGSTELYSVGQYFPPWGIVTAGPSTYEQIRATLYEASVILPTISTIDVEVAREKPPPTLEISPIPLIIIGLILLGILGGRK